MSDNTIEPTEEQREAAVLFYFKDVRGHRDWVATGVIVAVDVDVRDLARLLAEREHAVRARLDRALDIIVSQELDRDFGEEPTPTNLAVRALLAECSYEPERCSLGAVIGYSGPMWAEDMQADLDAAHARIAEVESHLASTQLAYETVRDTSLAELERSKKRIAELERQCRVLNHDLANKACVIEDVKYLRAADKRRIAELEAQTTRLDRLLRDEKLNHTKTAMSLHRCEVATEGETR